VTRAQIFVFILNFKPTCCRRLASAVGAACLPVKDSASKEPRSGFRKKAAIVVFDDGIPSGTRIVRRSAERRYAFNAGVQAISNI
jgi:hypothetical protein